MYLFKGSAISRYVVSRILWYTSSFSSSSSSLSSSTCLRWP